MSKQIILVINWLFGSTFTVWITMLMAEISSGVRFDDWIKRGAAITVFLLGLFKIYDWVERKYRKWRRYKKLKK